MIKICFVTTVSMTLKAFVVDLAKYLHETGKFEVSMICAPDEEFSKELPPYIRYYPIQMRRGTNLDGISATVKMAKLFKENRFDIVQYSTPNASLYASVAAFIARIPVRLYCQWGIAYVGFKGVKRTIFKLIEKMVCKLSTNIEPDSKSNLEFCLEQRLYPPQKGTVIWNGSASGVNLNKFDITKKNNWRNEIRNRYGISDDSVVYVFVGRVTADKGINELFEAGKLLLEIKENAYLLMVGANEVSDGINKELYDWSVNDERVVYVGFTNEVEKYMAASDVYVLPSYREGFGSSVIEAEAMGVPVIVTDIPGPVNAMQDGITGIVVKKADSADLYKAMLRLFEDEQLRRVYGSAASDFAGTRFDQGVLFEMMKLDREKLVKENYK